MSVLFFSCLCVIVCACTSHMANFNPIFYVKPLSLGHIWDISLTVLSSLRRRHTRLIPYNQLINHSFTITELYILFTTIDANHEEVGKPYKWINKGIYLNEGKLLSQTMTDWTLVVKIMIGSTVKINYLTYSFPNRHSSVIRITFTWLVWRTSTCRDGRHPHYFVGIELCRNVHS